MWENKLLFSVDWGNKQGAIRKESESQRVKKLIGAFRRAQTSTLMEHGVKNFHNQLSKFTLFFLQAI